MRRFARSPMNRSAAMILALLALAMRLLVPTGFMLAPAAAGGLPNLVICTGQGPMAMPGMTMAMSGADHDKHDSNDTGGHPCAFAAAGVAIELPALLLPALPPVAALAVLPAFGLIRPGLGLAAPPPPQTGPPSRS